MTMYLHSSLASLRTVGRRSRHLWHQLEPLHTGDYVAADPDILLDLSMIGSTQVFANDAPLEVIGFDVGKSPDGGYEAEGDDRRKMIGGREGRQQDKRERRALHHDLHPDKASLRVGGYSIVPIA